MPQLLAMAPDFAVQYLQRLEDATVGEQEAAFDRFDGQPLPSILSVEGDVARITISGPLSPQGPSPLARYFGFNGTGYEDIAAAVNDVKNRPEVTEVRFPTNTPGGTVTGVDETRQVIADLAKSKRVVFENHGMIASAGIWLASAAHEIIAMSPTVETGSIGVKIVGYDWTEYLESEGIKKVVILSRNAPNKAAGVDSEAGRAELKKQADAVERIFISRVAEGRGVSEDKVIDTFGAGGLLVAQDPDGDKPDAISVGLIDRLAEGSELRGIADADETEEEKTIVTPSNLRGGAVPSADNGVQASAHPTKQETTHMSTLTTLLAENPGAQAQYDAAIAAARDEGAAAGQAEVEARVKAAAPFLSADSKYPASITALAVQVVSGETDAVALTAAVSAVDAVAESATSREASNETGEQGETSAQEHTPASADGQVNSQEDFAAAVSAARTAHGLEE